MAPDAGMAATGGQDAGGGIEDVRTILHSALALSAFLAICAAVDPWAHALAGLKGPLARCAPRIGLYVLATMLWFLMGSPGRLGGGRLVRIGIPILLVGVASALLPDGPGRRSCFLAAGVSLAVALGRVLAQTGRSPADLLGLFLLGSACDLWALLAGAYECPITAGPWTVPPPGPSGFWAPWMSVPVIDLVFLSAFLEMARRYGFHVGATVSGAWAGFAGASLLQVALRRAVPAIPFAGMGVVVAAWPELRLRRGDLRRAALAVLAVTAILTLIVLVKWAIAGAPDPLSPRLEDLRNSI